MKDYIVVQIAYCFFFQCVARVWFVFLFLFQCTGYTSLFSNLQLFECCPCVNAWESIYVRCLYLNLTFNTYTFSFTLNVSFKYNGFMV